MTDLSLFTTEQIASLLAALPDPAFIFTRSGKYAALFGGTDARYYHDGSSLVGKRIGDVLNAEKTAWFLAQISVALAKRGLHVVEYRLDRKDVKGLEGDGPDDTIWFEGRAQALDYQVDGEDAVLWVASNITTSKKLEALLRMQSETDALTGLANRRKLMQALNDSHGLHARYRTPASVLIFDIDNFKDINDRYGHLSGDKAIQVTADVCRRELRTTDFPARLGGDEFVILMPHTTWEQAMPIAERLRQRIAEQLRELGTLGQGATISGGLDQMLPGDTSSEDVLKRADDALYRAKHGGRNRIVHHGA
ncbi:GGDEF domain-containing protein [Duganella sp. BJB488]|uniref:GGDEF domain-containing protein n=1 Tax=unclassified Duganella TaxID=2636909 RepID=UPI000E3566A6|nr:MULTISPECIES: GGDEF domain-containing protein [unclassified Duganella]NVD74795.1 GGDEF domain-containing protein [Duganella sp. BJB1802]RFP20176.1 GGDEF domain-containing protein [Duganella sp. BJB489]RFP21376.1 GGDEF domain-containing protein [Duganella sp. BJB488]RFP33517.1 GGDEF domain-containing protein [Duganella sp. BJB480]